MKYLLDTHAWIWWNARPEALPPDVVSRISGLADGDELLLSAMSILELSQFVSQGRLALSIPVEDWIARALDMPRLRLVGLSPAIACRSTQLPGDFHADAADRVIVATAREENAVILTGDERILNYRHARSMW